MTDINIKPYVAPPTVTTLPQGLTNKTKREQNEALDKFIASTYMHLSNELVKPQFNEGYLDGGFGGEMFRSFLANSLAEILSKDSSNKSTKQILQRQLFGHNNNNKEESIHGKSTKSHQII